MKIKNTPPIGKKHNIAEAIDKSVFKDYHWRDYDNLDDFCNSLSSADAVGFAYMLIMGQGIAEDIADDGVFDQGHSIELFLDDDMEMSVRVNIAGNDNDDSFFDFLVSSEADNPKNWDKYIVSVESTVEEEDSEMYNAVCDRLDKILRKSKRIPAKPRLTNFPGWDDSTHTFTTAFIKDNGDLENTVYKLDEWIKKTKRGNLWWDYTNYVIEGSITKIDKSFNDFKIGSLKFEPNKPYEFDHAFNYCEFSFDTLILPEGTKSVDHSFLVNRSLKAIYLPRSVEYIDYSKVEEELGLRMTIYCAGNRDSIYVVKSRHESSPGRISQEKLDQSIIFNTTPSDMIAHESVNRGYSKYSLVKESGIYRFKHNK